MKKLFIALIILLFSVSFVHAVTIASGSVTCANKRLSMVNGTAFVDFSAADVLTDYIGKRIVITDSAGKKATGYIKAAGTGETLGDELVVNGHMETGDPPTGWVARGTPTPSVLSSVEDEHTGGSGSKSLNVVAGSDVSAAHQSISFAVGQLWKYSGWVKNIDADYVALNLRALGSPANWMKEIAYSSETAWKSNGDVYDTVPAGTTAIYLYCTIFGGVGKSARFDGIGIQQVLTPSETGVTITSTPNGTTYNWTSIESGFNYNDASGYTYTIESVFGGAGGFTLLNVQ